jgi:hypothetical protein
MTDYKTIVHINSKEFAYGKQKLHRARKPVLQSDVSSCAFIGMIRGLCGNEVG